MSYRLHCSLISVHVHQLVAQFCPLVTGNLSAGEGHENALELVGLFGIVLVLSPLQEFNFPVELKDLFLVPELLVEDLLNFLINRFLDLIIRHIIKSPQVLFLVEGRLGRRL